jgi:hypothetical protein
VAANDPVIMLTAPIPATELVLEKAKLKLDDIDVVEINEAFASVVLAWERSSTRTWPRSTQRRGHRHRSPDRLLGARLMATLLNELERTGGRYGLQTMCEGGGQANATIIERPSRAGSRQVTTELLGRCTYAFPAETSVLPQSRLHSTTFETVELSRRGRIWSYTDARYQPPPPYVAADPYVPFCLAAVELAAEKLVVMGQVVPG